RAGRRPSPPRRAPRRRCGARPLFLLLQPREVERADRLRDELAVAVGVELLADDDRRRLEREVCDLGADLLERALPFGLGLLAHPLLHRVARLPRRGEDSLGVALRLPDQRAVLLEQLPR